MHFSLSPVAKFPFCISVVISVLENSIFWRTLYFGDFGELLEILENSIFWRTISHQKFWWEIVRFLETLNVVRKIATRQKKWNLKHLNFIFNMQMSTYKYWAFIFHGFCCRLTSKNNIKSTNQTSLFVKNKFINRNRNNYKF